MSKETSARLREGNVCPKCDEGRMEIPPIEDCSCHLCAPCFNCENNFLTCDECGYVDEWAAPPIAVTIILPTYTPPDPSKPHWTNLPHSSCSMIKKGTYPEGMTQDELYKLVQGTFGGHFESFGDGNFRFIAYTD